MENEVENSTDSTRPSAPVRRWLYLLTGLLIGGFFLYITARNVNLDEALAAIYAIESSWLIPLTLIFIVNLAMRSIRWRLMFPDGNRPSLRHAIDAYLIGRMGNNFMPGRLGELLRASVIGRLLPDVGLSGSLAIIVIEKLFDSLAVLLLLGVALLSAPLPTWLARAGLMMIAAIAVLLLVLWVLDRVGAKILYSRGAETSPLALDKLKRLALATLKKFSTGLYALRTAHHFTVVSALTLIIWGGEIVVLYICMQAFTIDAPFMAAVVSIVFLSVGSMLPAAPGFIGTYQLFLVAALQLYAVSDASAFALSIFLNVYVISMTTFFGVIAIVLDGGLVNLKQVFELFGRKA